jgi:prevent-host-death family protein
MHISVSEAHNRLSHWLDAIKNEPVTITRRGEPVGVIVSPQEYERLSQVKAYLQMLRLSRSLSESGVTAEELSDASRKELEERL